MPARQFSKEIVEVVRVAPQERVAVAQQNVAVRVPSVQGARERFLDVPLPQRQEQLVEVPKIVVKTETGSGHSSRSLTLQR